MMVWCWRLANCFAAGHVRAESDNRRGWSLLLRQGFLSWVEGSWKVQVAESDSDGLEHFAPKSFLGRSAFTKAVGLGNHLSVAALLVADCVVHRTVRRQFGLAVFRLFDWSQDFETDHM